ncbi:MAG: hypothetical protein NT069_34445, partial [Planctomycetota bacterium]|nr:hypothetical protein [Planctomycetota bacterium]
MWQGRFKALPLQGDDHLATVRLYVERNPVRAEWVARAEHWKWSSLPGWLSAGLRTNDVLEPLPRVGQRPGVQLFSLLLQQAKSHRILEYRPAQRGGLNLVDGGCESGIELHREILCSVPVPLSRFARFPDRVARERHLHGFAPSINRRAVSQGIPATWPESYS